MSSSSLTLPYVVEDEDRRKPFTRDMEVAAVLCLAEAKRKKPGILGAPPEKLSFISKLHYPLWAVPWENELNRQYGSCARLVLMPCGFDVMCF